MAGGLASVADKGWPSFCPVYAGAHTSIKPQEWCSRAGHSRGSDTCPVRAEGTGGRTVVQGPAKVQKLVAQAGWGKKPSRSSLQEPALEVPMTGEEPKEIPGVSKTFLNLFHVETLRKASVGSLCKEVIKIPMNSFQMGISLAQLLLAHPRDGDFVVAFLRQVEKRAPDTPTRRDLLPFQFCPSAGAAIKVISMFPVSAVGLVVVDGKVLNKLPRQQAKKLTEEGMMQLWRWLVVTVLNREYMDWCPDPKLVPANPTLAQLAALEMISCHVRDFCGNPLDPWVRHDFDRLLQVKCIDYSGDEVTHALPLRLEELQPGLPEPSVGGSLDAMQVVDMEVRSWLEKPERTLRPRDQWPAAVPTAKINASRMEWYRVVKELHSRNILAISPEQDIFQVDGVMVLNGAFAVEKSGTPAPGESRITRFIMNMTPSNAYQVLMRGDLQTLSSAPNWASLVIPKDCCLLWSSDDQKGAFYAWKLPKCWRGLMTFRWPVPGPMLGHPSEWVYVCSAVIPMGWLNAVSLFQHLHRQLGMKSSPDGAGFEEHMEWRRDRAVPQGSRRLDTHWIQYYLDDFDAPEIVLAGDVPVLQGTVSDTQKRQREAYERNGVDISLKKSQSREAKVVRMGAEIDGLKGLLSAPLEKRREVLAFTLWLLAQRQPKAKGALMVLGRMVRCFEFRRPLMSALRNCWPTASPHVRMPLKRETARSLMRGCLLMPMAVADLRCQVDGLVSASDASETGGGLCISHALTDEGRHTLEALQGQAYEKTRISPFRAAGAMPETDPKGPKVFVLSLFDGVAAVMCALSRLPCQVVGFAASEIDKECKRLVRRRWPGVIELGKVEDITEAVVNSLVNSLGFRIDILLISAGSPCQDLTALLANRQGLEGNRSKLFFHIPRIRDCCKRRFPGKTALLVENVYSMTEDARAQFTEVLGVRPILIMASDFSWVRRPRLYWIDWDVTPQVGEQLVDHGSFLRWRFPDVRCSHGHWVDEGWSHLGKECLPTFTRALPRAAPPRQPAGLATASERAQARWMEDRFQFQVYQYEDPHVLWQGSNWRLPSLPERERLMGFDEGYISNALPTKMSASEKFRVGCGMIGNTFHVHSINVLCHALLTEVFPGTPPRDLRSIVREVGFAPPGWTEVPQFSKDSKVDPQSSQLVHEILRQGDRAGTDIRLDVGIPFRFKAFPRAGLRTSYFRWRIVHGYKWQHHSHINALELQGVVSSLQWRLRKLANYRKRVLHLVDSQVVASVVAKGRTSSFRLRKGLQKLNSLLVTSGIRFCIAYCHTSENPADIPSRWSERKKQGRKGGSNAVAWISANLW